MNALFQLEKEDNCSLRLNWHARLLYLRYLCTVIRNWEFHLEIYLGKNKICFIIKYSTCQMWDVSHFDALKRLNFHMRILNMDHSETELLLVYTYGLNIFFFYLFVSNHSFNYSTVILFVESTTEICSRIIKYIDLSWELLTYVRAFFRITVCQKACATILINHNIGLECQLVSYFVIFWNSYRRSKFPLHWLSGRLSYDLRMCAS